jgi:hypothetical protein
LLLALLAVRTRGGERLLVLLAFVPFAAAAGASFAGPNLLVPHYFCFTVLFLCAAAASLVTLLPGKVASTVVSVAVAGLLAQRALASNADRMPDYREVLAHLRAEQRGSPAVIDSFDYFTLTYFAPPDGWMVYGADGKVPRFNGGPLLTLRDRVVSLADLERLRGRFLLIENDGGFRTRRVPTPQGARVVSQRSFGAEFNLVTVSVCERM